MNKCLLFSVLTFLTVPLAAQQEQIIVNDFSEKYYAKVNIDEKEGDYGETYAGWIGIYDVQTNTELFRTNITRFGYDVEEGNIRSNIKEIPYGEQSLIMYEDFNFDGINDFAIRDGFNSCYSGPSYEIYIAKNGSFVFDEDFTDLGQSYCGMFGVDSSSERLYTMTKSGCCWHQSSEYIIKDNKPFAVKIVERDAFGYPFVWESIQEWIGENMDLKKTQYLDRENVYEVLSFLIDKNNKRVVLFHDGNNNLYYSLLANEEGMVEFSYPDINPETEDDNTFLLNDENGKLSFSNPWATYTIYETENTIGIDVLMKGKVYNMEGRKLSQTGSLSNLKEGESMENLLFE